MVIDLKKFVIKKKLVQYLSILLLSYFTKIRCYFHFMNHL